jgi:perosamine synthetase
MEYQTFDPTNCDFPRPKVAVLPALSRHSLRLRRQATPFELAAAPNARFYTRGRYALTDAYRLCGVGPESTLLAPAYHCRTMLDPAIRLGASLVLYPLQPNLQPALDGLMASLRACDKPPAALLFTHFFGFAQPINALLELCNNHGIILIEDCSHCLFLPTDPNGLGRRGRYSVSSPYKFFPIEDGGILWANHGSALPSQQTTSPSLKQEIKGIARSIQRAVAATASPDIELTRHQAVSGTQEPAGVDSLQSIDGTSVQYDTASERTRALRISRWALSLTDTSRLAKRRRARYQEWVQAVADLPNCQALFPVLPQDCVPYMFALCLQKPEVHFQVLKRLGVPVWRWDDMAVSPCAVAMDYRTHLLHLPCHQELTDLQMHWLTSTVAQVISDNVERTGG